jgi:5-methylcytosine-specific restriction protein B
MTHDAGAHPSDMAPLRRHGSLARGHDRGGLEGMPNDSENQESHFRDCMRVLTGSALSARQLHLLKILREAAPGTWVSSQEMAGRIFGEPQEGQFRGLMAALALRVNTTPRETRENNVGIRLLLEDREVRGRLEYRARPELIRAIDAIPDLASVLASSLDASFASLGPRTFQSPADRKLPLLGSTRRYWVEKSIVQGRPDRMDGPHALGRALWSPEVNKAGQNIYRSMRDVRSGDLVFHLVDNAEIKGVSIVDHEASTEFEGNPFRGVDASAWSNVPCLRVQLRNYEELDPPLHRRDWLSPEHLADVLNTAQVSLFFNRNMELRQGAYLTEAPAQLVALWDEMYMQASGSHLPHVGPPEVAPPNEEPPGDIDPSVLLKAFSAALASAGLHYGARHDGIVRAFLASVLTKRFVILTGLSGSGKTQLALQLASWLGSQDRRLVLPVRPDWTGSEALFGYENVIGKADSSGRRPWHVPPALEFMIRARDDQQRLPHILVLDEMNLAHVERYFADVLSGMESREPCLPNLERVDGGWFQGATARVPVPENLWIIGTVNVDETTYTFSPKVLDRANTIEFRVERGDLPDDPWSLTPPSACVAAESRIAIAMQKLAGDRSSHRDHVPHWITGFAEDFRRLHGILADHGLEYGHRVYFDATRFACLFHGLGGIAADDALDLQVLQKVLPRVHGSRRQVEPLLISLLRYAWSIKAETDATFNPENPGAGTPRLPHTYAKIRRMLTRVRANQYVSFTE